MSLPMPAGEPHSQIPDIVDRPVVRATGPAEIVQLVPYMVGFHPHDSLVMMALRGRRIVVSVRYDLDAPVDMLLPWFQAARRAGADRVVAVVYTSGVVGPPLPKQDYADELGELFADHGLEEVDAIVVSDGRWWSYRCQNEQCCPSVGTPIDATGAIAASAVSEGMVALSSREALESELEIDELAANIVDAEIGRFIVDKWTSIGSAETDDEEADDAWETASIEAWKRNRRADDWAAVRAFVKKARKGRPSTPPEAARVLYALGDRSVRDAAMGYLVARPDPRVRDAWRQLTRVAPPDWRPAPATLYAMWCYAAGSGARTNVGIDVALAADPGYTMAQILLDLQATGMNPFEFINDMAKEAERVGRRIQRRRDPLGRQRAAVMRDPSRNGGAQGG